MRSLFVIAGSVVLGLGLFCSSVAAQKYDYYTAAGTDFTKFKTYKWHRADDAKYPEADLDNMFLRTIDAELAKKNMVRIESEDADVYVVYQIAVVDDMQWSSVTTFIPGGSVAGVTWGFAGATVNRSSAIQKGSFILDVYDAKKKDMVWQAHVTKTLAQTTDLKKREKNFQKIAAKIFKSYPVQTK